MFGLTFAELWVDYVGLGGSLPHSEIRAFMEGRRSISDYNHDLLAQALNEHFLDSGADHPLPYADEPTIGDTST